MFNPFTKAYRSGHGQTYDPTAEPSYIDRVCEPETVLPSQFFEPSKQLTPEAHLAWRVLMQAIVDSLVVQHRHGGALDTKASRLWILSDDIYPFSFVDICQQFDINHQRLRQMLRQASKRPQLLRQFIRFTGMKRIVVSHGRHQIGGH